MPERRTSRRAWKISWGWLWLLVASALVILAGIYLVLTSHPCTECIGIDGGSVGRAFVRFLVIVGGFSAIFAAYSLAVTVRRAKCHRCGAALRDSRTCPGCGYDFVRLPG